MKIIINTLEKEQPKREISITEQEARRISYVLQSGGGFITIGLEQINTKYIIGIFDDNDNYIGKFLKLPEPRKDPEKVSKILDRMRENLKQKQIIK